MTFIPTPNLEMSRRLGGLVAVAALVGEFGAWFVVDLSPFQRIVLLAVILAGMVLCIVAWFAVLWASAQWGRARAYPRLFAALVGEQETRARIVANLALNVGLSPLPVDGLIERDGAIRFVLSVGHSDGLRHATVLLLVDSLDQRVLATAEVDELDGHRAEASITHFNDALTHGHIIERLSRLERNLPDGTAVFSEAAIYNRLRELRDLSEIMLVGGTG
jgi:hypothetical protein